MNKNILIVDDEISMCQILSKIVKELGFECEMASNGQEAYDLFLNIKYDLIITDMIMPVMDGKTMINKIRKHSAGMEIPIIILSGYISIVEVKDLLDEGATYFINKPIDVNNLIEYIRKSLNLNDT